MVKLLCDYKADVGTVHLGIRGTPLQAALYGSSNDKDSIIRYLVEDTKANVNQSSPWWGSPLNLACLTGSIDIMK